MAPVRSYTNWNSRITDEEEQIEPYRKYFFICEGANTETWYFKKLIDIRKELNIHPLIDIRLLEKTEGDRDISFPRRLIEFAEDQKENPEIAFDKERDKMIVVFDGDIFEEKVLDYDELVAEGEKNNILAVSNPAFELFLLLHYKNSYEDDIGPNTEQIIQNEKDGHQTFISAKGSLPVISVGSLMKFEKMTENKKAQNKHSIFTVHFPEPLQEAWTGLQRSYKHDCIASFFCLQIIKIKIILFYHFTPHS